MRGGTLHQHICKRKLVWASIEVVCARVSSGCQRREIEA